MRSARSSASLRAALSVAACVWVTTMVCVVLYATPTAATDPTICRTWTTETVACNCFETCQTCYSCGCSWLEPWNSCHHDSCNDCGCAWFRCSCCRDDDCAYSCDCVKNCQQCSTTYCAETWAYSVSGVSPPDGSAAGGTVITVSGTQFYTRNGAKCRLTLTSPATTTLVFNATVVSPTEVQCTLPTTSIASWAANGGTATGKLEVSMDLGNSWTENNHVFTLYQCPGQSGADKTVQQCSGHGVCQDAECACNVGWWGLDCTSQCPGGSANPCSGHSVYPDCSWGGDCNCKPGWWGTACEHECPGNATNPCGGASHGVCQPDGACACLDPWVGPACAHNRTCTAGNCSCSEPGMWGPNCDQLCPGGVANPCSLHGTCDYSTGACFCNAGYWGDQCERECAGSHAGNNFTPCYGHGTCTTEGDCTCVAGYYGSACNMTCPGGAATPCSGHAQPGTCNADGTCSCAHGWWGPQCASACPGGAATPCNGHGKCYGLTGQCQCDSGFAGLDCNITCPGGAATPCSGHGLCDRDSGVCSCVAGYYGSACENACPVGAGGAICSGLGVCSSTGQCVCPGYWGATCENACPGDITVAGHTVPCSGRGTCDTTSGACTCTPGAWGVGCENACPGGLTNACNGNGACNATTGACTCNAPFIGVDCSVKGCLNNCTGHGRCLPEGGACQCDAGWTGTWCSQRSGPAPVVGNGVISFTTNAVTVKESSLTVRLPLSRSGGSVGPVWATVATRNLTAVSGLDFVHFDTTVYWAAGDTANKEVLLTILEDTLPEDTETLLVNITGVFNGATLGPVPQVLVTIAANDQTAHPDVDAVEVQVRLNMSIATVPEGSVARANFKSAFVAEVAFALSCPQARVGIDDLRADPQNPDEYTFLTFHLLPSGNRDDPTPADLARNFLQQLFDRLSPLYTGSASRFIDGAYMPVITSTVPDTPSDSGGGNNKHIGLIVGVVVTLAVVLTLLGVCYWKRKPLTDWLLWKLGNFRFNRFQDHEHGPGGSGAGDRELPERPVPLASAASGADTLTLAEPAINSGGAVDVTGSESTKLTLSSDSERNTSPRGPDAGVGHEALDAIAAPNPANDL